MVRLKKKESKPEEKEKEIKKVPTHEDSELARKLMAENPNLIIPK